MNRDLQPPLRVLTSLKGHDQYLETFARATEPYYIDNNADSSFMGALQKSYQQIINL